MRFVEEQLLKSSIAELDNYAKTNPTIKQLFKKVNDLAQLSLQEKSFAQDREFLQEIGFVLSVISSIAARPIIKTKGEDTILRQELAPSIQPFMVESIVKDEKLWKRKYATMLPEDVHYYQSIDEIITYENLFVVKTVNKIDSQLSAYKQFYIDQLKTFQEEKNLSDDKESAVQMLEFAEKLLKHVRFIRDTFFYKEVSKGKMDNKSVQPTNILMKNRLYNYVYKFFLKMKAYNVQEDLEEDFYKLYLYILFRSLKKVGFTKVSYEENAQKLIFTNSQFRLEIGKRTVGFCITVSTVEGEQQSNNLLMFDADYTFENSLKRCANIDLDTFDNVDCFNIWAHAQIVNGKADLQNANSASEEDLLANWLRRLTCCVKGSASVYSRYCPCCKSRSIAEVKGQWGAFECAECKSKYALVGKNDDKVWFIRLRRGQWRTYN